MPISRFIVVFNAVFVAASTFGVLAHAQTDAASVPAVEEPLRPLPLKLHLDQRKVALGKRLFLDPRLSRDNSVSCSSCHAFSAGGADARTLSVGAGGRRNSFNTPTVFNSNFNFRQQWEGQARTLEDQLELHIKDPAVFDTGWDQIIDKLSADTALSADMKHIYGSGMQRRNIIEALTTFERSLITPSRFDRYLRGDDDAITLSEKMGYAKFKSYGCVACHQGINVGGNMFQGLGVMRERPGKPDKRMFKVPGLRNVALTAPYFHDGSASTLAQAIDDMFTYQLGRTAPPGDKALIAKFLQSLSAETLPSAQAEVAQ